MPGESGGIPIIYAYAAIFLIFYFLVIRPQKNKQKEQKSMISNIQKNDHIVTAGGMHGTVALVKEKTVVIRVDENVRIEFDKESISTVAKTKKDLQPAKV